MSLLSLLIALAVDRTLSSKAWRFHYYYQRYQHFFSQNFTAVQGKTASTVFILLPVLITVFLLHLIDNELLELVLSTLILIVCFGCVTTRNSYKEYLKSAFRGEETTTEMHHQQLLTDKNLPELGFGQALIWLNYRYYIAIMLYFVVFGAAGAIFYRLLTTVIEQKNTKATGSAIEECSEEVQEATQEANQEESTVTQNEIHESQNTPDLHSGCKSHHDVLFWLDWLPVRIASFGYMFVGHFSKAMPTWLESIFDSRKPTHKVLIDVAQKSEDIMVNDDDCTAEPCLLVRLAKRNVLLILAVISILTLTGFIH
jgi:AmpE protein